MQQNAIKHTLLTPVMIHPLPIYFSDKEEKTCTQGTSCTLTQQYEKLQNPIIHTSENSQ